jgi:hypothetical protein
MTALENGDKMIGFAGQLGADGDGRPVVSYAQESKRDEELVNVVGRGSRLSHAGRQPVRPGKGRQENAG